MSEDEEVGPSIKFDGWGGTFRRDDIVIGVGGIDHFQLKPAGEVIETVLIGEVRDPGLDCCHISVVDLHNGEELLHSTLRDFEDEKVRITIERCD